MLMVELPNNYHPSSQEEYMNPKHLQYFKNKLLLWREELLKDSTETLKHLQEESWREPDVTDQASVESETSIELRTRSRYLKLLEKIDSALERIETKEYGYCEETGEEIGIARLEARPIANLTIEAQEKRERQEKQYIEDD